MNIKLSDVPTFRSWIEEGNSLEECPISDYIKYLQNGITDLVVIEDAFAPARGEDPSEDYTAIHNCVRSMGYILHGLKAIRREVKTAMLLNE